MKKSQSTFHRQAFKEHRQIAVSKARPKATLHTLKITITTQGIFFPPSIKCMNPVWLLPLTAFLIFPPNDSRSDRIRQNIKSTWSPHFPSTLTPLKVMTAAPYQLVSITPLLKKVNKVKSTSSTLDPPSVSTLHCLKIGCG